MKAIDFFCGIGGLTRGLLDAGIDVVAGTDIDDRCRKSFVKNNPGVHFVAQDITTIGIRNIRQWTNSRLFSNMLFAGCAPCQSFSKQCKGAKQPCDATLLTEFGRLVQMVKPGHILIENVPGIAKVNGFSTFRRFLQLLTDNGYQYAYEVIDAKHFGVPQTRRRLVLIASRGRSTCLPDRKFGTRQRPFRTVRETISHFPELKAGESDATVLNHLAAALSPLNLERLRCTPHDGGDRRSWPIDYHLKCHSGQYSGHTDVYGRMRWDQPAPTLTGRCNSISNGRYGHPEQDRAISLREAAALQTFPDGYEFIGFQNHIAQQIGNAVPVRLAEELGKQLLRIAD